MKAARRHRERPATAAAAFTLVETLVVVAVIALLMGVLLPALRAVRASGVSARCTANLRQMAIAAQHYAATRDAYPAAILYERRDGMLVQVAWDWISTLDGQLISPGPLWSFTDDPGEVMQCPAYAGGSNFSGDPFTGYNYNTSFVGHEEAFTPDGSGPVRPGTPPHACRRTSPCAMFGCGGWSGGASKFMRAPMDSEGVGLGTIYAGGQAFRHHDATNVAYLDGHVASTDRSHPGRRATPPLLEQIMGFPDHGFLSDDDHAYDPR